MANPSDSSQPQKPASTQTHYAGQHGWNDLTPEPLAAAEHARRTSSGTLRRPRRVISPYPPSSGTSSAASSASSLSSTIPPPSARPGIPVGTPNAMPNASLSPSESAPAAPSAHAVLEQVHSVLTFSAISDRERQQSKSRLDKVIPTLGPRDLSALASILEEPNPTVARERLVTYSLQHSGTSTWVVPLRRALDQMSSSTSSQ